MWYETFDAIFFISSGTLLVGLIGLCVKYTLKSKCEHFSLCYGLINVTRRVDLEVEEEIKRIELGVEEKDEEKNDLPRVEINGLQKSVK